MGPWFRRLLLRLAIGKHTYEHMRISLAQDPRTRRARLVDIVIRKDGVERRVEADWLKTLARLVLPKQSPAPEVESPHT